MDKPAGKSTSPPLPSRNNVGFHSVKNKHCVCIFYAIPNIGGRGMYFHARVGRLDSPLVGKKYGDIFVHIRRVRCLNSTGL